MKYEVLVSAEADATLKKWKKSNPILLKKYNKVIHELEDHPHSGIGHPEPLVGGAGITYSRRISVHDRIIYDIYEDRVIVLVISIEGHYKDK